MYLIINMNTTIKQSHACDIYNPTRYSTSIVTILCVIIAVSYDTMLF